MFRVDIIAGDGVNHTYHIVTKKQGLWDFDNLS